MAQAYDPNDPESQYSYMPYMDGYGYPDAPGAHENPPAPPAASPTATAPVTYTVAGYLGGTRDTGGSSPVFQGSDGKHYLKVGDHYSEMFDFDPKQIFQTPEEARNYAYGGQWGSGGARDADPTGGGADGGGAAGGGNPGVSGAVDRVNAITDNIPQSFYDAPAPFAYSPQSYPTIWDDPAQAAAHAAQPGFHVPTFNKPDDFSYPDLVLPSGEEVLNQDPGYGIRVKEGTRAIKNDRSSRGISKSGATGKALIDYAEAMGSQEYGQAVDRKTQTWGLNRAAKAQDYDTLWRNLLTDYGVKYGAETDAFNRSKGIDDTNFGRDATAYGFGLDVAAGKAGGKQGATSLAGNLALGSGNLGLNSQNSNFNNLLSLYDISTRSLPTYQPTYPGTYGFSSN